VQFDLRQEAGGIVLLSLNARAAPRLGADGVIDGVLLTLVDNSEQETTRLMTALSLQEAADLKAALDAHAMVIISDAGGIITQVNDRFCDIARYRRSDLIGRDLAITRSGMHPAEFYEHIDATVQGGQVWTGEVCNRARDGTLFWTQTTVVPFATHDGAPVQHITLCTDITERKQAEQQARQMALYDELTGLPNRRLIVDHVQQACATSSRSGKYGAVMLLDLDNFKEVNDTQGHDQGDELLRRVAQRLQDNLRATDTVARLGATSSSSWSMASMATWPAQATKRLPSARRCARRWSGPSTSMPAPCTPPSAWGCRCSRALPPRRQTSSSMRTWRCTGPRPAGAIRSACSTPACRPRSSTARA